MFSYLKNTPVVFATLIGSVAFLLAVIFGFNGLESLRSLDKTISVTGSAEKVVESDSAKWSFAITRSAQTDELKEGNTVLQSDVKKVIDFLAGKGIAGKVIERAPTEIQLVCFNSTDSNYDRFGNRICASGGSYSLSSRIIVNTEMAKEIADISQQTTEYALSQNITIANSNVEFFYNKLTDLRVELLGAATENAKLRAEQIAKSTGKRLGSLQSASMGVFQVTSKQSVDFSDYGSYDTSTFEKKVTAIVRTAFSLK